MKTIEQWFEEYLVSHRNPTNVLIHKICVPSIMFSVLGLFWYVPVPSFLQFHELLNWCTLFLFLGMIFYATISIPFLIGMIIQSVVMVYLQYCLARSYPDIFLQINLVVFVLAWIGQFIGHKIEGRKPSFFQDLQFLLIGPLWTINFFYKKIGFGIDHP